MCLRPCLFFPVIWVSLMKDITSLHKPCLTITAATAKFPTHLSRKMKSSVHGCLNEMWIPDNFRPLVRYLCRRDRLFCFTWRIYKIITWWKTAQALTKSLIFTVMKSYMRSTIISSTKESTLFYWTGIFTGQNLNFFGVKISLQCLQIKFNYEKEC